MPTLQVEYKGMMITAGAFEVVRRHCFIPALSIRRKRRSVRAGAVKEFDPPCPKMLFDDAQVALDCTIAYGRAIVDGEVPGLTVDDLKANRGGSR